MYTIGSISKVDFFASCQSKGRARSFHDDLGYSDACCAGTGVLICPSELIDNMTQRFRNQTRDRELQRANRTAVVQ